MHADKDDKTMIQVLAQAALAGGLLLAAATAAQAAPAQGGPSQAAPAAATAPSARYERDRQAILAMAGTYKVRFDFRETAAFTPGYQPIPAKISGGHEVVRVIEDRPGLIRLQHLLVVEDHDGKPAVVKHWRQDWVYEPQSVLTYGGKGRWGLTAVAAAERSGAWSQTVWQTDDSPRYGGVGRWVYDDGVARWTSNETWRPLARRDAVRHPVYDRYVGTNRHALTPTGWVHEQDNAKIGTKDGASVTFVHEAVLNTYQRADDFPVAAADAYWARTKDYWAEVRAAWDEAIRRGGGVSVTEEAESGSVLAPKLMGMADDIAAGKAEVAASVAEARKLIAAAR